jgi:hypothetical protein
MVPRFITQFEPLKLLATCRIIAFDWALPVFLAKYSPSPTC